MRYGYRGRLVYVDLTKGEIEISELDERIVRQYLLGSGLGIKILLDNFDKELSPLDPESPMIFISGLLTGTPVPTASKLSVCLRSPLTGIWNESTVGGDFGAVLKFAGYDGIYIKGRAERPVYLFISKEEIKIEDATSLWGKDTYEVNDILKEKYGKGVKIASIGPAGENLVKIASINVEGRTGRAAGRGGPGAVMGSKNLKAIVVSGRDVLPIYDKSGLTRSIKELVPQIKQGTESLTLFGTVGGMVKVNKTGDLPIKNFYGSLFTEGAEKTSGMAMKEEYEVKDYRCYACPIACGKHLVRKKGFPEELDIAGPEYETGAGFGALLLNDDLETIVWANDLCNRLGLDTISTSMTIAFAMELSEKKLIDEDIPWGDGEKILSLVEDIAYRRELGDILAEGTRAAARKIGHGAEEYSVDVKGLELPMHDPRAFTSMAINYATGNRGGCHLESLSYYAEQGLKLPGIKMRETYDPHSDEGKAELAVQMQNYMNVYNALGLCKFLIRGNIGITHLAEWVKFATGMEFTPEELLKIGERLFNLKRVYNVSLGISRKDDFLPPRIMTWAREDGGAKGVIPHIGKMLNEYYKIRGWSEEGLPVNCFAYDRMKKESNI